MDRFGNEAAGQASNTLLIVAVVSVIGLLVNWGIFYLLLRAGVQRGVERAVDRLLALGEHSTSTGPGVKVLLRALGQQQASAIVLTEQRDLLKAIAAGGPDDAAR